MANEAFKLLKLKIGEWLYEVSKIDPHLIQLKKDLEKLAVILAFAGVFPALVNPFLGELFWVLSFWILIFVTYLGWKYR